MKPFRLWIYRLLVTLLPESRCFGFKVAMLRWAGANIGRNVRVYSSVSIVGNGNLTICDDVHIGPHVGIYVSEGSTVTLASYVDIGPRVTMVTGSHHIDPVGRHIAGSGTSRSIVVGEGSWLGACSTLLPGAILKEKTVVAAGAVVCGTYEKGSALLAGVPAKVKKSYSMSPALK